MNLFANIDQGVAEDLKSFVLTAAEYRTIKTLRTLKMRQRDMIFYLINELSEQPQQRRYGEASQQLICRAEPVE